MEKIISSSLQPFFVVFKSSSHYAITVRFPNGNNNSAVIVNANDTSEIAKKVLAAFIDEVSTDDAVKYRLVNVMLHDYDYQCCIEFEARIDGYWGKYEINLSISKIY